MTDTARGVPEEMRETVFERFRQVSRDDRWGLGALPLRGIVQSHGARIRVEAGPKGGASFRFTFPA